MPESTARPHFAAARHMMGIAALFAAMLTVFAAFAPQPAAAAGSLVFARASDAVTLDPARAPDLESTKVIANIYEGLVTVAESGTEIVPALARSWESSADGTRWTFHLRHGVVFHDGTPLTAQAVVQSFMRQIDPERSDFAGDSGVSRFTFRHITAVSAPDDHTVLITLDAPFPPFLHNMSMATASVISPAGGDIPAGTGPFRLHTWEKGRRIVLKAHTEYWRGAPQLDTVVLEVIPKASDRLTALNVGAIDAFDGVTSDIARHASTQSSIQLSSRTGLRIAYLAMNTQKPPFDNPAVRRALNMAVNKIPMQTLIYGNTAVVAHNVIPETVWAYDETLPPYVYDPAAARDMLAQAGYPQGFTATLYFCPRPFYPEGIEALIRNELAAVNVRLDIRYTEWTEHLKATGNAEHDMCIISWGGYNSDPDNFFYPLFHPHNAVTPHAQNRAFYTNPQVSRLIEKAQQETDPGIRKEHYRRIQRLIRNDAPWIPLVYNRELLAHSVDVTGLRLDATGVVRFYGAHVRHD